MRVVIQRVKSASVSIEGTTSAKIGQGLLVFLGVEDSDNQGDISWLSGKIARLRVFNDSNGVMNRSVVDIAGELLVVSQFTLFASTRKGNRPAYGRASRPSVSLPLYEKFKTRLQLESGLVVQSGTFGADMQVELVNDGPVTIIIDSKERE